MNKNKIVFRHTSQDYKAVMLAQLGFSTAMIANNTGLTESQIQYRTKIASIKRSDYRSGTSATAKVVLTNLQNIVPLESRIKQARQINKKRNVTI